MPQLINYQNEDQSPLIHHYFYNEIFMSHVNRRLALIIAKRMPCHFKVQISVAELIKS